MRSFNYVIKDRAGIHARPAGIVVKEAKKYGSHILVKKGDSQADAVHLMQLMSMGIRCADEITVEVTGDDEEAASAAMEKVFRENL